MLTCSISTLDELIALSVSLGVCDVGPLADAEREIVTNAPALDCPELVAEVRAAIARGHDPLGDAYMRIVSPRSRRRLGQTYTPPGIVQSMVAWASDNGKPDRIIDPGAGSGRFLIAAARAFPDATLIGVDIDPTTTLMLRANLAAAGLVKRAVVVMLGDYRELELRPIDGKTLFIGNPPYVRHHGIAPEWKKWLARTASQYGIKASGLSGLHAHFFLATAQYGRPGDFGALITSAEWLDVNYGSLVRELLLGELGAESIHIFDPAAAAFADAAVTSAVTCFQVGSKPPSVAVRRIDGAHQLGRLDGGAQVSRERLTQSSRWSVLTKVSAPMPSGFMELGELCRVHRGAATGANAFWVREQGEVDLPGTVLAASVTRARELFGAGDSLDHADELRRVVDLPADLDVLCGDEKSRVERFIAEAKRLGVHEGYLAAHRKSWWSIGLREPTPVLATYMARRPPTFVVNRAGARHINIAHGLYPRQQLGESILANLASYLRRAVTLDQGRMYAGGLTKFEPKEMERLPIPDLDVLASSASWFAAVPQPRSI